MITNVTDHENSIASDTVKSLTRLVEEKPVEERPVQERPSPVREGSIHIPYTTLHKSTYNNNPTGLELLKVRGGTGVTVNPQTKRQELSAFGTGWNSTRFEVG